MSAEEKKTTGEQQRKAPELLAPAGELAGVIGAVNAGADAVYLGAEAFSARAYAKNLNAEDLLEARDYAHIFGRKIYLACNILLRDEELKQIPRIIDPLYEHGLDGIIVQDLGLLGLLHERYPELPLHASTQMSVLSAAGAEWLKKLHVSRVVPGRELSLPELRAMKAQGIEVECFIHGAMCYSYSGRCLLSSLAGGRSGNRGRCAGPCRQPYRMPGMKPQYALSLKDMWSLHALGKMIDAGIDSFKIEGRMKAPEYTAGVTAVYRKYIDRYLAAGSCEVEPEDVKRLESLYLRSGKQEGYLFRHNGREMVSLGSPAYGKVSEAEKARVHESYLKARQSVPVQMHARIISGEPMVLSVSAGGIRVSVKGALAEAAQNRPMSGEAFAEKLSKTGGTLFRVQNCRVETDGAAFVPVGKLNELRREALAGLQEKLLPKRQCADVPVQQTAWEKKVPAKPLLRIGLKDTGAVPQLLAMRSVEGLILEMDVFLRSDPKRLCDTAIAAGKKIYLRLPEIIRQKDTQLIRNRLEGAAAYPVHGIYLNGIDALGLCAGLFPKTQRHGDQGLYVFNQRTQALVLSEMESYTHSIEQSGKEWEHAIDPASAELILYGYLPVMYSANCALKTLRGCSRQEGVYHIEDEKGHSFPILPVHEYCYNVMYNCVPLSLHAELPLFLKYGTAGVYRLEFTVERMEQILRIAQAYAELWENGLWNAPFAGGDTTRGHFHRGAE